MRCLSGRLTFASTDPPICSGDHKEPRSLLVPHRAGLADLPLVDVPVANAGHQAEACFCPVVASQLQRARTPRKLSSFAILLEESTMLQHDAFPQDQICQTKAKIFASKENLQQGSGLAAWPLEASLIRGCTNEDVHRKVK